MQFRGLVLGLPTGYAGKFARSPENPRSASCQALLFLHNRGKVRGARSGPKPGCCHEFPRAATRFRAPRPTSRLLCRKFSPPRQKTPGQHPAKPFFSCTTVKRFAARDLARSPGVATWFRTPAPDHQQVVQEKFARISENPWSASRRSQFFLHKREGTRDPRRAPRDERCALRDPGRATCRRPGLPCRGCTFSIGSAS